MLSTQLNFSCQVVDDLVSVYFAPVYPTPLISVRFRESVFRETGHTIMNLLAVSTEAPAVSAVSAYHHVLCAPNSSVDTSLSS